MTNEPCDCFVLPIPDGCAFKSEADFAAAMKRTGVPEFLIVLDRMYHRILMKSAAYRRMI